MHGQEDIRETDLEGAGRVALRVLVDARGRHGHGGPWHLRRAPPGAGEGAHVNAVRALPPIHRALHPDTRPRRTPQAQTLVVARVVLEREQRVRQQTCKETKVWKEFNRLSN
jgi:hypothetical protein